MSLQAYYDFENNYNDTSGNAKHGAAVGAGISFITQNPMPSVNSYCAKTFTDANYMSIHFLNILQRYHFRIPSHMRAL